MAIVAAAAAAAAAATAFVVVGGAVEVAPGRNSGHFDVVQHYGAEKMTQMKLLLTKQRMRTKRRSQAARRAARRSRYATQRRRGGGRHTIREHRSALRAGGTSVLRRVWQVRACRRARTDRHRGSASRRKRASQHPPRKRTVQSRTTTRPFAQRTPSAIPSLLMPTWLDWPLWRDRGPSGNTAAFDSCGYHNYCS